jgi:peptidoglycan/LPS O-acetylase OafA/YrhL
MVFLFHYWLAVQQRDTTLASEASLSAAWAPLLALHHLGFLGVQLFFVISGFCIHYSYLSWKRKSPGEADRHFFPRFYSRRFWRIVPPYLIALVCFYLLKTRQPLSAFHLEHFAPHLILGNTLFPSETFSVNPSFWSVAVEWQLYLVYPLVLMLFSRLGTTRGFLIAVAIGVFFRFTLQSWNAPYWLSHLPFRWWYEWTLGVLIAASWSEKRRLFYPNLFLGLLLAAVTVFAVLGSHDLVFQWLMPPFFFAFLVEVCVWSAKPVGWFERSLGLLGICSYSFYLWHQPLLNATVSFVAHYGDYFNAFEIWIPLCAVILAGLTLLSAAFYQLTEKPSIAVGQWWARRKALRIEATAPFQTDGGVDLLPTVAKPD